MNQLKVMLWGEELGRLVWDSNLKTTYFSFNPEIKDRPDVAPLIAPVDRVNDGLPIWGDDKKIYQKLPPFIADSLPDAWGNRLFDKWVRDNGIPRSQITPLYKLMFIGKRGMGALEFEPASEDLNYNGKVDIKNLYDLSLKIIEEREETQLLPSENLTMDTLIAIGTSAGGRQMKAIVAINSETGEVRSGQVEIPNGFENYLLKFADPLIPSSEIELCYYEMARSAGIHMEESSLLEIDDISHFLTKRFDREGNQELHMQTLAAINPEADSYEELLATCRKLNLSEKDLIEVFRRMVFNVIANNTDDHNKNFSFLLDRGGEWRLSPAYDLTFIFNRFAAAGEKERCLSLFGKTSDINKNDLIDFAYENNINSPQQIIGKIVDAVKKFPELALKHNLPEKFSRIITATISKNLFEGGFIKPDYISTTYEIDGKRISLERVFLNSRGIYDILIENEGQTSRRFIAWKDDLYEQLHKYQSGMITEEGMRNLLKKLI